MINGLVNGVISRIDNGVVNDLADVILNPAVNHFVNLVVNRTVNPTNLFVNHVLNYIVNNLVYSTLNLNYLLECLGGFLPKTVSTSPPYSWPLHRKYTPSFCFDGEHSRRKIGQPTPRHVSFCSPNNPNNVPYIPSNLFSTPFISLLSIVSSGLANADEADAIDKLGRQQTSKGRSTTAFHFCTLCSEPLINLVLSFVWTKATNTFLSLAIIFRNTMC